MPGLAPLLLAAGAFLLLSRRDDEDDGDDPVVIEPVQAVLLAKLLPLEQPFIEANLLELDSDFIKDSGVPIYRGFPTPIMNGLEPGYELIDVWVYTPEGTYPDPRRFFQWNVVMSEGGTSEAKKAFNEEYYFGVSEDGDLKFYAIGKPYPQQSCCQTVECKKSTVTGSGKKATVTEEAFGTDHGGHPLNYKAELGEGWECTCLKWANGCYVLMPQPQIAWPLTNPDES